MEFIKRLNEQNEAKERGLRFRVLNKVVLGDYYLSIQGSCSHYCTPRKNLSIEDYSHLELAIFYNETNNWSSVFNIDFNDFKRIDELRECGDGDMVCAYVPVDLIEDFYQYLKTK